MHRFAPSPATRLILKYILEHGQRPLRGVFCVVVAAVPKIEHGTQCSRRQIFRALNALQKSRQLQRIQGVKLDYKSVFHLTLPECHREAPTPASRCPQVAEFRARYKRGAILSYISGEQIPLFGTQIPEWTPMITDEELRWREAQLRRQLGLPAPASSGLALWSSP